MCSSSFNSFGLDFEMYDKIPATRKLPFERKEHERKKYPYFGNYKYFFA